MESSINQLNYEFKLNLEKRLKEEFLDITEINSVERPRLLNYDLIRHRVHDERRNRKLNVCFPYNDFAQGTSRFEEIPTSGNENDCLIHSMFIAMSPDFYNLNDFNRNNVASFIRRQIMPTLNIFTEKQKQMLKSDRFLDDEIIQRFATYLGAIFCIIVTGGVNNEEINPRFSTLGANLIKERDFVYLMRCQNNFHFSALCVNTNWTNSSDFPMKTNPFPSRYPTFVSIHHLDFLKTNLEYCKSLRHSHSFPTAHAIANRRVPSVRKSHLRSLSPVSSKLKSRQGLSRVTRVRNQSRLLKLKQEQRLTHRSGQRLSQRSRSIRVSSRSLIKPNRLRN